MIIFIYGENSFSSKERLDFLKREFILKYEEINYVSIDFDNIELIENIVPHIKAVPFLSERRMVVIKNLLSSKKQQDQKLFIMSTFDDIPESTVLVVYEGTEDFDKRQKTFKALKDKSKLEYFKKPSTKDMENFILFLLKGDEITIDSENLSTLTNLWKDKDFWNIKNELIKLKMHLKSKGIKEIVIDDIKDIISISVQSKIFDLVDFIGKKQRTKALQEIKNLLDSGENEFYILSMIVYHFRVMIMIKSLTHLEYTSEKIKSELKLHPFVVNKAMYQVKNYTLEELKSIYKELLYLEEAMKTGKKDPKLGLSIFIANVSKRN